MALVASTILGLMQNLKAFGGILVVSPGALVVAWVGWFCGAQVGCGLSLLRRPRAVLGCSTSLPPPFLKGPVATVITL